MNLKKSTLLACLLLLFGCNEVTFIGKLKVLSSMSFNYIEKDNSNINSANVNSNIFNRNLSKKVLDLSPNEYNVKAKAFYKKENNKKELYLQIDIINALDGKLDIGLMPIKLENGRFISIDGRKHQLPTSVNGKYYIADISIIYEIISVERFVNTVRCFYTVKKYVCEKRDDRSKRDNKGKKGKGRHHSDCRYKDIRIEGRRDILVERTKSKHTIDIDFISSLDVVDAKLNAVNFNTKTKALNYINICNNRYSRHKY